MGRDREGKSALLRVVQERLALKLGILVAVVVAAGSIASALGSAQIQTQSAERLHGESAQALARTLAAGVRSSMLTGNGIAVRSFLDDAKSGIEGAKVRVFAASGEEVFGEKPPPPPADAQPAHVRSVIASREPFAARDARAIPIANEARCRPCHERGELRGVLTLGMAKARVQMDGSPASVEAMASIVRAAFVQVMTAKREDKLDDYFAELAAGTPGLRGVAVFSSSEIRSYGDAKIGLPSEALKRGVAKGPPFDVVDGAVRYRVIPLANEPRCQGCHDPAEPMRGALVVAVDGKMDREQTLLEATHISLQHVMLAGLGRMVKGFLDDVGRTGVATSLTAHDDKGRLYHDAFAAPSAPEHVAAALASRKPLFVHDTGARHELVYVEPLANEERCQRCHGPDQPLRGAVEVRLDTSAAAREVLALERRSALSAGFTILLVIALLAFVLQITVIRPVQRIGVVADHIGEGRFDARVDVSTTDEMGRLGERINGMVAGLRQKLALSKFVSNETLRTVESLEGTIGRVGVRTRVAVLFSDIRGFTAFSETRQPEEVVAMLNAYLQAQADIVVKHGGDIDKFVGDELMARFIGPELEARATRCAAELVEAVTKLHRERADAYEVAIGVGVNAGEVVLGAMGSEQRMDFTVIGDDVNLSARLCGAAKEGEVLISAAVRDAFGELEGLDIAPLEPIKVKGKEKSISVFRVVLRAS